MKKLLGIVVLGLLLSGNAYAASKSFYLSCPSFVYQNDSKGEYKDSELFKAGAYVGHTFLKFKHTKKEYTKFPIYLMGYAVPPRDPVIWKIIPPHKLNADFMYHAGKYVFVAGEENMEWSMILTPFAIDTDKKEFNLMNNIIVPAQGVNLLTTSNYPPEEKDQCEILDKKKFNELIKKGIN